MENFNPERVSDEELANNRIGAYSELSLKFEEGDVESFADIFVEHGVRTYTQEEVEILCLKAYCRGGIDEHTLGNFDEWLDENF